MKTTIKTNKAEKIAASVTVYAWKSLTFEERLAVGEAVAANSNGRIKIERRENGDALAIGAFERADRQPLKYKTGAGWVYMNKKRPETWLLRKPGVKSAAKPKGEDRREDVVPERRKGEPKNRPDKKPKKNEIKPAKPETVKNPGCQIVKLSRPKKVMQSLYRMTSRDETRRIICAVHFEPGCMIATDSYRLAYVPFDYKGEPFELPNALVEILAKRIAAKSDAEIIINADKIGVRCTSTKGEQIEEFADKIEGCYPKWRQLEQETYAASVDIEPKNFAECVKRCSLAVSNVEPIAIMTDGKNAVMGAITPDVVSAREDLGMVASGEPAKIAINWKCLKDAVNLFDHPAQIRINGAMNPAVITDGNAWVLVMPVRRDDAYFKSFEPKSAEPKIAEHHEVKAGTSFCFTGGLKSMTRKTAERKLRERGFDVSHNVNKSTDYLVIADASIGKSSTKMRTAKKYDTPVMSESEFMALVA